MIVILIAIWIYYPLYAQQGDTLYIRYGENGKVTFASFAINQNSDRKMDNDIVFLKSILQARQEDEFLLKKEDPDEWGILHKRYQQYYRGIKVENAEYLLHGSNGSIEYINGDFQDISLQTIIPKFNKEQALVKALEYIGAEKYKWEDLEMEQMLKKNMNDTNATYYPQGELVIAKDYLINSGSHKLAWKFFISSLKPYNSQKLFVDANNGKIIQDVSLIMNANVPGTVKTMYSGVQNIICDSSSANGYKLQETRNTISGKSVTIKTIDEDTDNPFTNTNPNWNSINWVEFNQKQCALDVHWGVEKVVDYWSNVHGIDPINPHGLGVRSIVTCGFYGWHGLASWVSSEHCMRFSGGDSLNYFPATSLDIIAHEYGHAICEYSLGPNPDYSESGALCEGFSDIWGACVKYWANLDKYIWLNGNEIMRNPSFNCIRDLQNPKSNLVFYDVSNPNNYKYANTYKAGNWDFANTSATPYRNSTVLSHWFYLLCEGGNGINDKGNTYNVTGIGISKAEKIAYRTLVSLSSSADFYQARDISRILSGISSCDRRSIYEAWYAVGVGDIPSTPIHITSNTNWNNRTLDALVFVDSGAILTITGNIICYNSASITIHPGGKLIVDGGTLTNACEDEMWQGIFVGGNGTLPQTAQNQGILEIKNGAVIKNAKNAVT